MMALWMSDDGIVDEEEGQGDDYVGNKPHTTKMNETIKRVKNKSN